MVKTKMYFRFDIVYTFKMAFLNVTVLNTHIKKIFDHIRRQFINLVTLWIELETFYILPPAVKELKWMVYSHIIYKCVIILKM